MRLNGKCTQKNSGSPWVPGCPTDSSSATAGFKYRIGAGGPSMAADRTTAGKNSPHREKAGDAPWWGQTGNPSARGGAPSPIFLMSDDTASRLRRTINYIAMWNYLPVSTTKCPLTVARLVPFDATPILRFSRLGLSGHGVPVLNLPRQRVAFPPIADHGR